MRSAMLLLLIVALAACGASGPLQRTPDARFADEIEAKLRNVPCVGSMSRWERHYVYSPEPSPLASLLTFGTNDRWFNYRSIDIAYYQAGFEEFRAGRVLGSHDKPGQFDIDDRQYDLVFGHYDIPTHKAYIWACGPNFGGAVGDPRHRGIVVR